MWISVRLAQQEEQTDQRLGVLRADPDRARARRGIVGQRHRRQPDQLVRIDLAARRLAVLGVEDRHPLVGVAGEV